MSDEEPRPTLHVFYDYTCPYAYVGWHRARRLAEEHDVRVVWLPWEIHPERAPAGEPRHDGKGGQPVGSWVGELAAEVGAAPRNPPLHANSHWALRGALAAENAGAFERYHEAAFRALWEEGTDLSPRAAVEELLRKCGVEDADLEHPSYAYRLAQIDAAATRAGVQRVPTFVFGDQRVVGNDRFEPSLRAPLAAFLERWRRLGDDKTTTLAEDVALPG
jgi:2-hydroxychromene-2-carboxylate isomerase